MQSPTFPTITLLTLSAALLSPARPAVAQAPAQPAAPAEQTSEQVAGQEFPHLPQQEPAAEPHQQEPAAEPLVGDGEIIEMVARAVPGSIQSVGTEELARFEHDDVHQVLGSVPGVYIREEDGYGLRPNIGMRGADSERSAKIALMEDGVLIAPAPYAAPAAYYFPLVTRMDRVEVVKGPGSIQYGPNTVGGSVNMISRDVPRRGRDAFLDAALGQTLYTKLHAGYGTSSERTGFLLEGIKLRSDGFKQLDGGGSTGFDKNDLQLKLRVNSASASTVYHQLDLKLGYATEVSDETYTGLSDADFASTPYRRYAATQLDRMEWNHVRMQLAHRVDLAGRLQLTTTLYRNQFSRDWAKLNGFAGGNLAEVLANPGAGSNAIFYQILTGQSDSSLPEERLLLGTNARDYTSQGAQIAAHSERRILGLAHKLDAGLRYHQDLVDRFHFEDEYRMLDGAMLAMGAPARITANSTARAQAWAAYVQDQVRVADFTITAGMRSERIRNQWDDHANPAQNRDDSYLTLIPGAGVVYQALPSLGVLAGVHKGFVPVAPGSAAEVKPEQSINYEAGLRYAAAAVHAELIGFFSDYSNLKGSCSFSSGCAADQIDEEFNGGQVHVLGVEALGQAELAAGPLRIPLKGSYTFTRSRFQQRFTSDNPKWRDVQVGDELPYMPAHQLSLHAGVGGRRWEVIAAGRFVSAMRDTAGQGPIMEGAGTDAYAVLDLAANLDLRAGGKLYLTVDNVLDQAYIVSRRPYGARPGKPRLAIIGYKYQF